MSAPPGYPPPQQMMTYPPNQTITQQPGPGYGPPPMQVPDGWAPLPPMVPNCPRGLEYLTMVDQLLIKQKIELLEGKGKLEPQLTF